MKHKVRCTAVSFFDAAGDEEWEMRRMLYLPKSVYAEKSKHMRINMCVEMSL